MTVPKKIRNIADLAKLAGVSPGTVSRALTDSGLISQKTRDKIKGLAREHDFRPSVMARNLRIQRTGAIAIVIPLGHETGQHISDPFFMSILGHLADALTERGHDLLLSRVVPQNNDWLDRLVDSGRVDGVVLIGQSDQTATIDAVAARYRPLVVWGGHGTAHTHCTVGSDNRLGGQLATEHLLARGCQRIAFFGDVRAPEIAERAAGYHAALAAAGQAPFGPELPVHLMIETAQAAISLYLQSHAAAPDGIVCASDVIAMSALKALTEHGLRVPHDVMVIGYDDVALAALTDPPLSTIRQDVASGAAHLVECLFQRIDGHDSASVVLAPQLIARGSTR